MRMCARTASRPGQLVVRTLTVAAAGVVLLTGCSRGDQAGGEGADLGHGKRLFISGCRTCHTLLDADALGTFGPNLDELEPDADHVRDVIDRGGGGMPSGIYSGKDARDVAAYVEIASRKDTEGAPSIPGGPGGGAPPSTTSTTRGTKTTSTTSTTTTSTTKR